MYMFVLELNTYFLELYTEYPYWTFFMIPFRAANYL